MTHPHTHPQLTVLGIIRFLVVICAVVGTFSMFSHESHIGWDALPYLGIIGKQDHMTDVQAHQFAYAEVRRATPDDEYQKLIANPDWLTQHDAHETPFGDNEYRYICAKDYRAFTQQFPFYSGRIGYLFSARALHAIGLSWVSALKALSSVPSAATLWLITVWLIWKMKPISSLGIILLWVLLTPVAHIFAVTYPDAYCIPFTLGACLLVTREKTLIPGLGLSLIAVVIRPDSFVVTAALALSSWFVLRPSDAITRRALWIFPAVGLLYAVTIQRLTGAYPVQTLNYLSIVHRIPYPEDTKIVFSAVQYIPALNRSLAHFGCALVQSHLAGLAILIVGFVNPQFRPATIPFMAILASSLVRILIFPHYQDRYFDVLNVALVASAGLLFIGLEQSSHEPAAGQFDDSTLNRPA